MKPLFTPEALTVDNFKFLTPEISIIIPIFNEEESLEQLIEKIVKILVDCNSSMQIIS